MFRTNATPFEEHPSKVKTPLRTLRFPAALRKFYAVPLSQSYNNVIPQMAARGQDYAPVQTKTHATEHVGIHFLR